MPAADDTADEITTHQIDILRVAAGLRVEVIAELTRLEGGLVAELENNASMTVNKAARLTALLQQTQRQINDAYQTVQGISREDLQRLAVIEGGTAVRVLNKQIGATVISVGLSAKQLEAVVDANIIQGHSSGAWWAGQAEDLRTKFSNEMRQGFLRGETVDELARRVRGTRAAQFTDGLMPVKKREADALVRSSVISTANEARLRTMASASDIVKGIQWLATLDSRTTKICRGLDGLVWRLPDFQPVGHDKKFPGATAHWNCRSTQIPVTRSWEELSGKKLPSIGDEELAVEMRKQLEGMGMSEEQISHAVADTRASMDGQVAGDSDFESWLRTKTPAFVNRTLGPGRAAAWQTGEVTVADMTDQNNRPLTLLQLAAKIENGIPPPETLGVDFLALNRRRGRRAAQTPEPTESPEETAARVQVRTLQQSRSDRALIDEVTTEHASATATAQLAIFNERKTARDVAERLTDDAARKAAAGATPATVARLLATLPPDHPARKAWADKLTFQRGEITAEKGIREFTARSPFHREAANDIQALAVSSDTKAQLFASMVERLESNAHRRLVDWSEGRREADAALRLQAARALVQNPGAGHDVMLQVQEAAAAARELTRLAAERDASAAKRANDTQTARASIVPVERGKVDSLATKWRPPTDRAETGLYLQSLFNEGIGIAARAGSVTPTTLKQWHEMVKMSPVEFKTRLFQNLDLPGKGFKNSDMFIKVADGYFDITVSAIHPKGGKMSLQRRFYLPEAGARFVDHSFFSLPDHVQGTALGKALFRNQLALYDHMGLDYIDVHANIDVGGYAWARYGFKMKTQNAWFSFRTDLNKGWVKVQRANKDLPPDLVTEVNRLMASDDVTTIRKVAGLGHKMTDKDGKATTLGKLLLLGTDWFGRLNLTDTVDYKLFHDYIKK